MIPKVLAPRYMLPFIIFSTLSVLNNALSLGCEEEAETAFSAMESEGSEIQISSAAPKNKAKSLAVKLLDKTPSIYAPEVAHGAGIRFKNALNENSKKHAHFGGFPDAFHNEIEAWEDPRTDFAPVFLKHSSESDKESARVDKMVRILAKAGNSPIQVMGRGTSSLAQLTSMVYKLDMVSYYIAIGLGRDPFPTRLIDAMKKGS
jgi:glucose/mannose-6-phosphate isomerase